MGFSVAYTPKTSKNIWIFRERSPFESTAAVDSKATTDSPVWFHCIQLPGAVREVSVGRTHGAALTTSGEGKGTEMRVFWNWWRIKMSYL